MRFLAAFFVLLSTAHAQLTATVNGPTTAKVGEIIELRADAATGSVAWGLVQGVPYKVYENGTVLVFAAPTAGRYEAIVFIAVATADGKVLLTNQRHVIQVGGGPSPPEPSPPGPPTPPPTPAPFAELTALAKSTAPAANRDDVRANFRLVATMVVAGTVPSWEQLVSETAQRNRAVVGDATQADNPWNPFFSGIGKRLAELRTAGKLSDKSQWTAAWNAIAEGL